MKKEHILANRIKGNPDRAGEMGVQLHRARKAKPDDEAMESKPDNERKEGFSPAKNLGVYHHPPKRNK